MPTYVAMLRSLNVSGHNRLAMEKLRSLVASAGYDDVSTYVQSGNVVCSGRGSVETVGKAIEGRMTAELGWSVPVIVRTRAQIGGVVTANPFRSALVDGSVEAKALYVTFLAGRPEPKKVEGALADVERFGADRAIVVGKEVYLHCPGGYGRTKLDNAFFERRLALPATTRNWRTVTTLAGLVGLDV